MSPLRRVRFDDEPDDTYVSDGPEYGPDDIAPADVRERERRRADEDADAIRDLEDAGEIARPGETPEQAHARKERLEDGEDDPRDTDLSPAIPERRKPHTPVTLTPDEKRVKAAFQGTGETQAERHHLTDSDLTVIDVALGGVGAAAIMAPEDVSAEPVTKWLRDHEPRRTLEGVQREIEIAATDAGLTLAACRDAMPSSGGRPTAARRALRAKVRNALAPMYADGRSRTLMAEALACSRPTLDRLMRPDR
jgi:hypothetical protein